MGESIAPLSYSDSEDVDSIYKDVKLNEIIVKSNILVQYPEKEVWLITKKLRQNAFDVKEMIGNIPGMYLNRHTEELTYNGKKNILILMDGKEKPSSYVEKLSHNRFSHVEVTNNPHGQYRNYDVVINLITKERYEGIEGHTYNNILIKPEQEKPIFNIAPSMTLSYTRSKKFNLAAHYDYQHNNNQTNSLYIERIYPDYSLKTSKYKGPVESSLINNHNMWLDVDYDINKNHSVSLRYTYANCNSWIKNDFMVEKNYTEEIKEDTYRREFTNVEDMNQEHIVTMYYRGKTEKWEFNSDVTYNFYKSDNDYRFNEYGGIQLYTAIYNQKHYIRTVLNATHTINKKTRADFGYTNIYRKYKSNNESIESSSSEYRNQFYASLYRTFGARLSGSINGNVELLRNKYLKNDEQQCLWSLSSNIRYRFKTSGRTANIGYNVRTTYPNQRQLNPIGFRSGYDVWITGNPTLKPTQLHMSTFDIGWEHFSIWAGVHYSPNQIVSLITENPNHGIEQSYHNIKHINAFCGIRYNYSKTVNKNTFFFNCSFNIKHTEYKLKTKNIDNKNCDVSGGIVIGFIARSQLGQPYLSLAYDDKGYGYEVLPQGKIKNRLKTINALASANFFNNKLKIDLKYSLPLNLKSSNWQKTETTTPVYQTLLKSDLFESQHMISLNVRWRFAYGHQIHKRNNTHKTEYENNNLYKN